jgi:hypothetical protein
MTVVFERTGWRRYAVRVCREGAPQLVMDPAPGFDRLVPHDLLHMIVEARLGLDGGIFGQIARDGDAGTFGVRGAHPMGARAAARDRRRRKKRGARLRREGAEDSELSELATYLCRFEWLRRSTHDDRRGQALAMREQAASLRRFWPQGRQLDERVVTTICSDLDELSARWSRLAIGESMSVEWPHLTAPGQSGEHHSSASPSLPAAGGLRHHLRQ